MDIQQTLVKMIADADRGGANRLIEEWGAEHGYDKLIVEVLGPVLRQVGVMWQKEETFSLAHCYVAAKIAQDALEKPDMIKEDVISQPRAKGPVVLGNIEDDCHSLGCKLVAAFLRADGWKVHELGIDVEAKTFVNQAVEVGAQVIGVSAMLFTTAKTSEKFAPRSTTGD